MLIKYFIVFVFINDINSQQIPLWVSSSPNNIMPAGNYVFPFEFRLETSDPNIIPPNIDYTYGSISYFIVSHVHRPGLKPRNSKRKNIKITPTLNINQLSYNNPSTMTTSDQIYTCSCSEDEPVYLTVEIPRMAYCPGTL